MRYAILLLTVAVLNLVSCNRTEQITEEYITQHLNYLASDEMNGRRTFSPEILEAERYIAAEFDKAGLDVFGDHLNYLQEFELIEIAVSEKNLIINETEINPKNIAFQTDVENLSWANGDDVIVTYVTREDDFREEWGRFRRNDDNLLIIVDPVHQESFNRYGRWFNRANRVFEEGAGRSIVMALTDIKEVDDYQLSAVTSTEKKSLNNPIGWIEGKRKDEFVLFSAHHDHIGIRNRKDQEDSIYNGANDDASGTVAVMALARYYASQPQPERSIIFTTFTAEEMGGYGSRYFSNQLDPDQIVAMFNIEMIGKPAVSGPNTAWITGFDKSNLGEIMQNSAEGSQYEFYADPYPDQNLFYRSDNATLARMGVPAHTISTTPIDVDEDYHRASDEVSTLNLSHLTNTVKAIVKGAELIISGEETPTRVDPNGI